MVRGLSRGRLSAAALAVLLLTAGLQLVDVVVPSVAPRAAAEVTGAGGQFVPTQGRLVDTRNGTGGYTSPMPVGTARPFQIAGALNGALPTSGISAVQITLTVVDAAAQAALASLGVAPHGGTVWSTALTYGNGVAGTISNTAIVAVAADGKIDVKANNVAANLVIDVQGYYTAGATAAGGYVPVSPKRIVDTRNGTGLPRAQLGAGVTKTITVGGAAVGANVPAGASAVFVQFTAINTSTTANGSLTTYATGGSVSSSVLAFQKDLATSLGGVVPLSSAGQMDVRVNGVTIDLVVDVIGYFAPAPSAPAFTPASSRLVDNLVVSPNSTLTTSIAGIGGVPVIGSGLSAVAVNVMVVHSGTADGYVAMGPSDAAALPTVTLADNATRSNFGTLAMGDDGKIKIVNANADSVRVYVFLQGWYSSQDAVVPDGQSTTQKALAIQASNVGVDSSWKWVTYQYRSGAAGAWSSLPPTDVTDPSGAHPAGTNAGWPVQAIGSGSGMSFVPYTWDLPSTFGNVTASTGLRIQTRACYSTSSTGASPRCGAIWGVSYAPADFGYSTATTDIGVGELSLLTGDLQVSATDAAAATSLSGLSVGRTLTTRAAPAAPADAGVFGPGWAADFSGPPAGDAALTVADHSSAGYLTFIDTEGAAYTYQAVRSVTSSGVTTTTYTGVDDAAGDGVVVKMVGSAQITMIDSDGTTTTWVKGASGGWKTTSVAEPGSHATTSYTYDPNTQLATRILGPSPSGVTCTDANADVTPGCRSLVLTYGVAGGGRRLTGISLSAPPATTASSRIEFAAYAYDSAGYLSEAWDPRTAQVGQALKTTYTYDQSGRLSTVKPPGQNGWALTYDGAHRISQIKRTVPVGNPVSGATDQTAVTTVVYDVPNTLHDSQFPDLSNTASWGQNRSMPVSGSGAAIFGPNHVPSGTTVDTVSPADWRYAELHFLDVNGRETNTANYGASAAGDHWLIDSTQYSVNGGPVWQLSAENRAQALNPSSDTDAAVAAIEQPTKRADLLASLTIYNPVDVAEITDAYGPTHPITLANGNVVHGRAHLHTDYDEGAPGVLDPLTGLHTSINPSTGVNYRLPTTVTESVFDIDPAVQADVNSSADTTVTRSGYEAVGGMTTTGWDLGEATTSTVQMGTAPSIADDLVTTTVFDTDGRVLEQRLPGKADGDAAGNSPRTTKTTYYKASGSGDCVSAISAGLVCKTAPGGQPTGTSSPLATTITTYDALGSPLNSTETFTSSGTADATSPIRITTTTYDAAERIASTAVKTEHVAGSHDVPTVSYQYDTSSGLLVTQETGGGASSKAIVTDYDATGRVRSYVDARGAVTYTGYDIAGRVASKVDAKGATTWSYDEPLELRGMVTTERHASTPTSGDPLGSSGATDAAGNLDLWAAGGGFGFTAVYDAGGAIAEQTYPNGLHAANRYDNAGNPTGLTYTKDGATWMSFTRANGYGERVVAQSSAVGGQAASDQKFSYDRAGRLTSVQDNVGPTASGGVSSCEIRQYGFDQHSNRISLTTSHTAGNDACSITTAGTVATSSFDAADRITGTCGGGSGSYCYDVMGRTLTIPATDAVGSGLHAAATGQLAVAYYDNDLVATETQGSGAGSQQIAFAVDAQPDRFVSQTSTVGVDTPVVTTTTNHYDDATDSPAWTDTTNGSASTWEAYIPGPDGTLAASVDQAGSVAVRLRNLHGDVVATAPLAGASSVANYTESTEFGAPRSSTNAKTPYGWTGTSQRSTDSLGGFVLMGLRLYNPATGRFLSVDSVPGGNLNSYVYPLDPINQFDLDGRQFKDSAGDAGGSEDQQRSSKRTREAAERLARERNANSLTTVEVDGPRKKNGKQTGKRTRYHLRGKSHNGLPTPHVHEDTMHSPRAGVWNSSGESVRAMKYADIAAAMHGTPDMKMP